MAPKSSLSLLSASPHSNKKQRTDDIETVKQLHHNYCSDNALEMNPNTIQSIQEKVLEQDYGGLMLHSLSFLDVVTLLQKQVVSKQFKDLCTKAITAKCGKDGPKPLTRAKLKKAIRKYCNIMYYEGYNIQHMEEIACTYGFPIDSWNVSKVRDMSYLFLRETYFNEYIGSWDTSNVTNMHGMFMSCISFNQDIGRWNVSKVTNMQSMFHKASVFNQDIGRWNVSRVTNMGGMFYESAEFNQDIGRWKVSNVWTMAQMFAYAKKFNQDITQWDVSNVIVMNGIFEGADAFHQDIREWDASSVMDGPVR
ncbi:fibronectin domain containing protein [Nitzschia inconspicua]|uniref:Fibronectin domain containing protein n=1 Tax=Nitzschia inconspicua TaxID=303405 RepID=A0A9K3L8K0_9STRA|nr:fibronectin domain containing protein [Nitzschia inconspicua]